MADIQRVFHYNLHVNKIFHRKAKFKSIAKIRNCQQNVPIPFLFTKASLLSNACEQAV